MTKRPTEVVLLSLRIREEMRRRLAQAAKRRNLSVNQEIVRRLDDSFASTETKRLDQIVGNLEQKMLQLQMQQNLLNTAELLIGEHSAENVERCRTAIITIRKHDVEENRRLSGMLQQAPEVPESMKRNE